MINKWSNQLLPTLFKKKLNLKYMPIVKVIEVIASSDKGIDDAIRQGVVEASKTVRNIDSVYVKDIKAHVKDGQVTSFGCICKISFRID
jgi:dodecin